MKRFLSRAANVEHYDKYVIEFSYKTKIFWNQLRWQVFRSLSLWEIDVKNFACGGADTIRASHEFKVINEQNFLKKPLVQLALCRRQIRNQVSVSTLLFARSCVDIKRIKLSSLWFNLCLINSSHSRHVMHLESKF